MNSTDIPSVAIGGRRVGPGQPTYIVAEIGINHNGDLDLAKKMIAAAAVAGCDAVKFQKRTPEICVPEDQRDRIRETPWGTMTYMEYRERVEFDEADYSEIDRYCRDKEIAWFASPWDQPSVDFLEAFDPVCHKVASASLTDEELLGRVATTGRPVILSTERHVTLDRAMWGSDQAASVEPQGLMRLVRDIRVVEEALGDGEKRVYESELPLKQRLRR